MPRSRIAGGVHPAAFVVASSPASGKPNELTSPVTPTLPPGECVDLPRPRELAMKRTPEFVRYVDRIWRLIEDDVRESVLHENA